MNKNKSKEESRPTKKGHHDQRKESDLKTTLLLNKSESKIVRLEEDEEEEEKGNLDKTIIYREKGKRKNKRNEGSESSEEEDKKKDEEGKNKSSNEVSKSSEIRKKDKEGKNRSKNKESEESEVSIKKKEKENRKKEEPKLLKTLLKKKDDGDIEREEKKKLKTESEDSKNNHEEEKEEEKKTPFYESILSEKSYLNFGVIKKVNLVLKKDKSINSNVSFPLHLSHHAAEYQYSPIMTSQIQEILKEYPVFRRIRGDGNCFYRSVGFLWLEQMIISGELKMKKNLFHKSRIFRVVEKLTKSGLKDTSFDDVDDIKRVLVEFGLIEKHRKVFVELIRHVLCKVLKKIAQNEGVRKIMKYLTNKINKNMMFDLAMIFFMRNKAYESYLEFSTAKENKGFRDKNFDQESILVFGQDAETYVLKCLSTYIRMPINIISADPETKRPQIYSYGNEEDEGKPALNVYFRPGHYDLIYNKETSTNFYMKELQEVFNNKDEIVASNQNFSSQKSLGPNDCVVCRKSEKEQKEKVLELPCGHKHCFPCIFNLKNVEKKGKICGKCRTLIGEEFLNKKLLES